MFTSKSMWFVSLNCNGTEKQPAAAAEAENGSVILKA